MEKIMLDSNVIIDLIRNKDKALERLLDFSHYQFTISHFVYIEVLAGAQKHRKADTSKFLRAYSVLPFNSNAHEEARLLARRYHAGKPMDLLIAAHAKAEKVPLLTNNINDFAKFKGLKTMHYRLPY